MIHQTLTSLEVRPGSLAILWLGQAGFVVKTPGGRLIFFDAYLSDMCYRLPTGGIMSKRLFPSLLRAEEIATGLMLATHCHEDHFDEETILAVAEKSPEVEFSGPVSCTRRLAAMGIPERRCHLLARNQKVQFDGFSLEAVYADHGPPEPDAIGVVLESQGIRVYHTGDTNYCPEKMDRVIQLRPDVILPCINGTFGNLSAIDAARLAGDVRARVAIPCHYWMLPGQNLLAEGTPAAFLDACRKWAPAVTPVVLSVGESYSFDKALSGEQTQC